MRQQRLWTAQSHQRARASGHKECQPASQFGDTNAPYRVEDASTGPSFNLVLQRNERRLSAILNSAESLDKRSRYYFGPVAAGFVPDMRPVKRPHPHQPQIMTINLGREPQPVN